MFAKAGLAAVIVLLLAGSPVSAAGLLHCPTADLSVSMTGPRQLRPGEPGTLKVVVANEGDAAAWHVRLRVRVDPALPITRVPDGCRLIDKTIRCTRKRIAEGESWAVQLPVRALESAVAGSVVDSRSEVMSASDDRDGSDNSAAISTRIGKPFADLGITAEGPAEFVPERSHDLTFKIDNSGPALAPEIQLTGVIDDHLIVERLPGSCELNGAKLACRLDGLAKGAGRELVLGVRLGAGPVGGAALTSRVGVTGPHTDDPDPSDNDVTVDGRIVPARLSLRTSVGLERPRVGAILRFTVVVANARQAGTAADVAVTDQLPAGVDLVAAEPSRGAVSRSGGAKVLWSVGDLAAGESTTLVLSVRVRADAPAGVALVNRAGILRGPPATIIEACPDSPETACSTTDPVLSSAAPAAVAPGPIPTPAPGQASPTPRPTPAKPRPSPTALPTATSVPKPEEPEEQGAKSRIALVPFVPDHMPGPGGGSLLVISMSLTSVLVAIRLFLFLRRR